MNQVMLVGRVSSLPFYHTTEGAAADLTKFRLSTSFVGLGQNKTRTNVEHECIAWGPSALLLHQYLGRECLLAIRGSIHYHKFSNTAGEQIRKPEIIVKDFTFLGGKQKKYY